MQARTNTRNLSEMTIKALAIAAGDADPAVREDAQRGLGEMLGLRRHPTHHLRIARPHDGARRARCAARA